MHEDSQSARWLPIKLLITSSAVAIKWMNFGDSPFSEPFFHQTVRKLRAGVPAAEERTTSLGTLLEMARGLPEIRPAGVVFHISRCGSTLLGNALKTASDTIVLSEAAPIGLLFRIGALRFSPFPPEWHTEARSMLLNTVASLYGHDHNGRRQNLIIKCHTISILEIAAIRSIWPAVPFVVIIRNPVEVIVSNLAKPAGWVKGRRNRGYLRETFGWSGADNRQMRIEEYCARGIARFCELARPVIGNNCKVIDYNDLTANKIRQVAEFFGIALPPTDSVAFQDVISTYSKDPTRKRSFESDRRWKQDSCPAEVRESAQLWAWDEYRKLREGAVW